MHDSYKKWIDDGQPKIFCECPCHEEIIIKKWHKYQGIPKYTNRSHHTPWNKALYPIIFDLCACGCNETVWGGIQFIHGHHLRIMVNPMKRPEIVAQFMGDKNPSKRLEVRLKISESLKNSEKFKLAIHSEQHKKRQRASHLGKILTEEHKANIGIGLKTSEKYQTAIHSEEHSKKMSAAQMGHIGAMRGKTHSAETITKMKQSAKGRLSYNCTHGKRYYYNSPKQGIIPFRSSWELAYAKYLDAHNILWLYEIFTFDLDETTYTPDFFLPETGEFIEVKGYMHKAAQEKINKFLDVHVCNFQILYKADLIKLGVL